MDDGADKAANSKSSLTAFKEQKGDLDILLSSFSEFVMGLTFSRKDRQQWGTQVICH